ncbi:MAG: hypothetical protein A2Y81_03095 [Nitrospirae bacterium RBG_13_43_8]|nr:MAG: hypothetical protein A2Y81_03095 [Nitrospirae bacterium RBG_13_43_8]
MIHVKIISYPGTNIVIPACPVASGDSPRRESFFQKDSRQARVTERETEWQDIYNTEHYLTDSLDLCFNRIALRNGPVRPEGRGGSVSCKFKENNKPSTQRGEGFFMGF